MITWKRLRQTRRKTEFKIHAFFDSQGTISVCGRNERRWVVVSNHSDILDIDELFESLKCVNCLKSLSLQDPPSSPLPILPAQSNAQP